MPQLQTQFVAPVPIFNQRWPDDCPKSVAYDMDFTLATEYDLNMLIQNTNGQIEGIQSIYFDNSQNAANVNFICPDTGQRMFFRARWQGFRSLLMGDPAKGVFSCTGGNGIFRALLSNTPLMPHEWDATP